MSKVNHLQAQAQALLNSLEIEKLKNFKKQKKLHFHAVIAQSLNCVIGADGKIPWDKEPEDLISFAQITKNSWVIMGRKTFESLEKPLIGRQNLVLSKSLKKTEIENLYFVSNLNEMMEILPENKEVFIIGGKQIYENCFFLLDKISISIIKKICEGDVYYNIFEELNVKEWKLVEQKILNPRVELFYLEKIK